MRQPLVAGNWKMHKTPSAALEFFDGLVASTAEPSGVDVWLFPAYPALPGLAARAAESWIKVGAQNLHEADDGAFTGEVSALMLTEAGAAGVLVGHSERRHVFGESDDRIRAKFHQAIRYGLLPVLCVGETLDERDQGRGSDVVLGQIERVLADAPSPSGDAFVIAYEPVWAIGTGHTATPDQAREMHAEIRSALTPFLNEEAQRVRLLYGGSVKPTNAADLLNQPDVDGALVGGASLEPDTFLPIVQAAGRTP